MDIGLPLIGGDVEKLNYDSEVTVEVSWKGLASQKSTWGGGDSGPMMLIVVVCVGILACAGAGVYVYLANGGDDKQYETRGSLNYQPQFAAAPVPQPPPAEAWTYGGCEARVGPPVEQPRHYEAYAPNTGSAHPAWSSDLSPQPAYSSGGTGPGRAVQCQRPDNNDPAFGLR